MLSMTYAEVDQALASQEGLIAIRIKKDDINVYAEQCIEGNWIAFDTRPLSYKHFLIRNVYQHLRASGYFDPYCEFMTKLKFETSIAKEYQKEYNKKTKEKKREQRIKSNIDQMKSDIIDMTGFDGETRTKQVQFHGKTYYMYLCDDGISGPLFVSDNNECIKIDNDPEEFSVLKQVLENPWIEMPSHINA